MLQMVTSVISALMSKNSESVVVGHGFQGVTSLSVAHFLKRKVSMMVGSML